MGADWPVQLRTGLAATAGGAGAALIHLPLPWMIGSMTATAAIAWRDGAAVAPQARLLALVVLGLALGATFTGPVLGAVVAALPAIVAAGVLTIASGLLVSRLFMGAAGTDARTGYFCAVPGGIVVMAVLAGRAGASVAAVTLAQTVRMVLVVATFPPLLAWIAPGGADALFATGRQPVAPLALLGLLVAGWLVARLVRRAGLANPWMLGPCALAILLSGLGRLPSGVPVALVDAAQVAMGASLGARLTREFLLGSRRLLFASLLSSLALSVVLALLALPLAWAAGLPVPAALLGMAPGGMPEMAITAQALQVAVPLVLGFHLTRLVLCNLLIGPMWRLAVRLRLAG